MKKIFPLLLVVMLTQMGFSCEKTEDEPDPAVLKESVVWKSEGPAHIKRWVRPLPNVDSLYIQVKNADGVLGLQIDFKGVGTYALPKTGRASYYLLHHPETVQLPYSHNAYAENIRLPYYLDQLDEQSEVIVTEWDPTTKKIKGTFQCLVRKTNYGAYDEQGTTETIRFTGGVFAGTVIDI